MKLKQEVIHGRFIRECKNRFICEVLINNKIQECYIPSSSKLQNYLKLENKEVLLTNNKSKNTRTRYSVFAVKYYGKYVLLNLNFANSIIKDYIMMNESKYSFHKIHKEKTISEYKADFLLEGDNKIIIEVKGIISNRRKAFFPTVFSQRAINQLKIIKELLMKGINIEYYFVALSPITKEVIINQEQYEFLQIFRECITHGMLVKGFNVIYNGRSIVINKQLKIKI